MTNSRDTWVTWLEGGKFKDFNFFPDKVTDALIDCIKAIDNKEIELYLLSLNWLIQNKKDQQSNFVFTYINRLKDDKNYFLLLLGLFMNIENKEDEEAEVI
jgi:hypothetical protein